MQLNLKDQDKVTFKNTIRYVLNTFVSFKGQ